MFDGTDILVAEQLHTHAVLGGSQRVEVAQQGGIDGIAVGGDRRKGQFTPLGPLAREFDVADVVFHQVAVLDKAVLLVLVRVAVDGGCGQRLTGQRGKFVIVAHTDGDDYYRRHHRRQKQRHQQVVQASVFDMPAVGKQHHQRHHEKDDERGVGMDKQQEMDEIDHQKPHRHSHRGPKPPVATGVDQKEGGQKNHGQADIEREADMRDEGDDVAVGELRHGGVAHMADKGGHEDREDKTCHRERQLRPREGSRGEHDERDGQQGQLAEEVMEPVRHVIGGDKPHQMDQRQHQKGDEQRMPVAACELATHVPLERPVDGQQDFQCAHHVVAHRLGTDEEHQQHEIERMVERQTHREATRRIGHSGKETYQPVGGHFFNSF